MIETIFKDLLRPLSDEDKAFVLAYWDLIIKTLLTPYQRNLEKELSYNILSTPENQKFFYHSFVPKTIDVEFHVNAKEFILPNNCYEVVCYGDEYQKYETVTLPCRIDDAYDIVANKQDVVIDGNILLGEGECAVSYKTRVIPFVQDGQKIISERIIRTVKAKKGDGTPTLVETEYESLYDKVIYCPKINIKHAKPGTRVWIGSRQDTIKQVIDNHRFLPNGAHGPAGTTGRLKIELFPYAYKIDFDYIPEFEGNRRNGVDYQIKNKTISFPEPVLEPLIAPRAYQYSDEQFQRFLRHLGVVPEEKELYKPFWHAVFTNKLDTFLYASIGYPYVPFEFGKIKMKEIEYSEKNKKPDIRFSYRNHRVLTTTPYFDGYENAILSQDGQFYKIIRHTSETEVEVERLLSGSGEFIGCAAEYKVDAFSFENQFGRVLWIKVPARQFPLYKPEDVVETWSPLVTGVWVFDRTENESYKDYEGYKKFLVSGDTPPENYQDLLQFHTFIILSDELINIPDNLIRYVIPAWTQYHIKDNLYDRVSIRETADISSIASLVFGRFLPSEIISIDLGNITPMFSNSGLVDPLMPMTFLGDYNPIVANAITNLRWPTGEPLDISNFEYDLILYVVQDFGTDPATEIAPDSPRLIQVAPSGNILLITGSNVPDTGTNLSFSFVASLNVSHLSNTFEVGGVFLGDFIAADNIVKRVYNATHAFLTEPYNGSSEYIPSVYRVGEIGIWDENNILRWEATNGTRIVDNELLDTDFYRLGVRHQMIFVHKTDILPVTGFDEHGQVLLSASPVYDILSEPFGFYCFVARSHDGTIEKN